MRTASFVCRPRSRAQRTPPTAAESSAHAASPHRPARATRSPRSGTARPPAAAAAASSVSARIDNGAQCLSANAPSNQAAITSRSDRRRHGSDSASIERGSPGVCPPASPAIVPSVRRFAALASIAMLASASPTAFAQTLPSDPEPDSPSGVMYELPLDSGRGDAAPRAGGGTGGSDDAASGGQAAAERKATSIRSENNFGSSSVVPGAEPSDREGGGSGPGDSPEPAPTAGSSPEVLGTPTPSSDGPSEDIIFPMLALIVACRRGGRADRRTKRAARRWLAARLQRAPGLEGEQTDGRRQKQREGEGTHDGRSLSRPRPQPSRQPVDQLDERERAGLRDQ